MKEYPFSLYKPVERFAELAKSDLAQDMWHCVTRPESIERLINAIDDEKPAVSNMDNELHKRFSKRIMASHEDEGELRILCMNMMKQLLEHLGYEHVGCALCSEGEFVKSAGIFRKKDE